MEKIKMTEQEQEKMFERVKSRPLSEFGRREINIVFGGNREIRKKKNGKNFAYFLKSDQGTMAFEKKDTIYLVG